MVEKKIRPRSLERYSEEVRADARKLYAEMYFLKDGEEYKVVRDAIERGEFDEYETVKMAAFIVDKFKKNEAGVMCTGCGSSWSDERLAEEKAKRPALLSCCPERKVRSVYWCDLTT